jgi:hypothetical protein
VPFFMSRQSAFFCFPTLAGFCLLAAWRFGLVWLGWAFVVSCFVFCLFSWVRESVIDVCGCLEVLNLGNWSFLI